MILCKTLSQLIPEGCIMVIINDKIFVYCYVGKSQIIFCYLDLIKRAWHRLPLNGDFKSRNHQIMWTDHKRGKAGSVYIAFGTDPRTNYPDTYNFNDMCRYDVFEKCWYSERIRGNAPYKRAQAGFASRKGEMIMFGGYTETLYTGTPYTGDIYKFVYFGDAFKFCNKRREWKMIHCDVYPEHRAEPAMCYVTRKQVVLYGGYQGGANVNYGDLWILDLSDCQQRRGKIKFCAMCSRSSAECKLYLCAKCQNRSYCSQVCQKLDWKKHNERCKTNNE